MRTPAFRALAALAVLLLPAVARAGVTRPYGGDSPQAVVARAKAAAEQKNLPELVACMAPADRKEMAGAMLLVPIMMVAFSKMAGELGGNLAEGMTAAVGAELTAEQRATMEEEKQQAAAKSEQMIARLRTALEPHGLAGLLDEEPQTELDEAGMAALLAKVDDVALISDMMGVLEEMGDQMGKPEAAEGEGAEEGMPFGPEGKWSDFEVTDYQVESEHATAKSGEETVEFVKVDGRWYLSGLDKGEGEAAPGEAVPAGNVEVP